MPTYAIVLITIAATLLVVWGLNALLRSYVRAMYTTGGSGEPKPTLHYPLTALEAADALEFDAREGARVQMTISRRDGASGELRVHSQSDIRDLHIGHICAMVNLMPTVPGLVVKLSLEKAPGAQA